jgi:hypothetical protein
MPIVMVGPDCATGVRWARRNLQAVYLLDSALPETWGAAFGRLASDAEHRSFLGARALEAGMRDFDPLVIRGQFQRALRETATNKSRSSVH